MVRKNFIKINRGVYIDSQKLTDVVRKNFIKLNCGVYINYRSISGTPMLAEFLSPSARINYIINWKFE